MSLQALDRAPMILSSLPAPDRVRTIPLWHLDLDPALTIPLWHPDLDPAPTIRCWHPDLGPAPTIRSGRLDLDLARTIPSAHPGLDLARTTRSWLKPGWVSPQGGPPPASCGFFYLDCDFGPATYVAGSIYFYPEISRS